MIRSDWSLPVNEVVVASIRLVFKLCQCATVQSRVSNVPLEMGILENSGVSGLTITNSCNRTPYYNKSSKVQYGFGVTT